jgi:hypothetical protein
MTLDARNSHKDAHKRQAGSEDSRLYRKIGAQSRRGTDELTRIRNGRRQIRFFLEEVMALADRQEADRIARQKDLAKGS